MDLHKPRYRLKAIDLSKPVLNPAEITGANARIITFIRFAQDADGRYPQFLNSEGFQVAIDDAEEFMPFKPNDSIKALGGPPFSKFKYRNLVPIDGWAIIMLSEDVCIDNQRPDVQLPLKNSTEPEIQVADTTGTMVTVNAAATVNIRTIVLPTLNQMLIWGLTIWQLGDETHQPQHYWAGLLRAAVPVKSWLRGCEYAAEARDSSHIEWDSYPPLEILNTGILDVNIYITIENLGGSNAEWGSSISYSLLPINPNSDPPGDIDPLS